MTPINTAALINLLGFTTGVALYAMLLFTVLRRPARGARFTEADADNGALPRLSANALLLATAALGLVWNVGALASYGVKDFGVAEPHPLLVALSFAALGFLPAVVVHSALQSGGTKIETSGARWITISAYGLSAVAAAMHFYAALLTRAGLSNGALRILTIGYVVLILALFLSTRRQPGWKRAVWASALAVFAVSALHLSQHHYGGPESWPIELLGHHASLPLALAILYQDYRFAFADIFLKRALSLLSVVALAFGLYVAAASPLLEMRDAAGQTDPRAVGVLLGLWVMTALLYPALNRAAVWFVDTIVLRRANYREMLAELARQQQRGRVHRVATRGVESHEAGQQLGRFTIQGCRVELSVGEPDQLALSSLRRPPWRHGGIMARELRQDPGARPGRRGIDIGPGGRGPRRWCPRQCLSSPHSGQMSREIVDTFGGGCRDGARALCGRRCGARGPEPD